MDNSLAGYVTARDIARELGVTVAAVRYRARKLKVKRQKAEGEKWFLYSPEAANALRNYISSYEPQSPEEKARREAARRKKDQMPTCTRCEILLRSGDIFVANSGRRHFLTAHTNDATDTLCGYCVEETT